MADYPHNTSRRYATDRPGDEGTIVAELTDLMWALIQEHEETDPTKRDAHRAMVAFRQGTVMGSLIAFKGKP